MARAPKTRLDTLLVERELCDTSARAQSLIMPGTLVERDAPVRLRGQEHAYVSRGGLKLRGALDQFTGLVVRERVAMDIGASTGGFTDCLLQAGVARVYAVDVGYGQLAWKLSQDPRVVVLDRTNIRWRRRASVSRWSWSWWTARSSRCGRCCRGCLRFSRGGPTSSR